MNKLSGFILTGCILFSTHNVIAQTQFAPNPTPSIPPKSVTVRLNKVNQIGYSLSVVKGVANRYFTIKGATIDKGIVVQTHKISGLIDPGISENCIDLASKQNLNSLAQASSLVINFTIEEAKVGSDPNSPINFEYLRSAIKSCYISNN